MSEQAQEDILVDGVESQVEEFRTVIDTIKQSLSSVRKTIQALREKQARSSDLDTKDGISLLSLKHHLLLSYLHSLVILVSRRTLGDTLADREPPSGTFSSQDRPARGSGLGDRIDSMVGARLVLEKIKVLEGRMQYQIEKLVRVAEEPASHNVVHDPLAFKPNPEALMNPESGSEAEEGEEKSGGKSGVYRPPKLAPVPYIEPNEKRERTRRAPVPSALATLEYLDPSRPWAESTSGLGSAPALMSQRARDLQRMTEFEEENMSRLVMKKKDAKRRKQDEADLALGGTGAASSRRGRGGGFEDEFGDILRSAGRSRSGAHGDGYEELRQRGKKESVLARSHTRSQDDQDDLGEDGPRQRKRSRFDKEVKSSKRKLAKRR